MARCGNTVSIVTGGASGIGVASRIALEGGSVVVADTQHDLGSSGVAGIESAARLRHNSCRVCGLDLGGPQSRETFLPQ
jgi:NAD(P)-dependent dehydrogenase (short-subunit alcohol dehydrogenase family)